MEFKCKIRKDTLDEFKSFLDSKEVTYRPGIKDLQQILQVDTKFGWAGLYDDESMPDFYIGDASKDDIANNSETG